MVLHDYRLPRDRARSVAITTTCYSSTETSRRCSLWPASTALHRPTRPAQPPIQAVPPPPTGQSGARLVSTMRVVTDWRATAERPVAGLQGFVLAWSRSRWWCCTIMPCRGSGRAPREAGFWCCERAIAMSAGQNMACTRVSGGLQQVTTAVGALWLPPVLVA